MITYDFLLGVVVSLFSGALIGMERAHSKRQFYAGIRTFSLISLFGFLTTYFTDNIFTILGMLIVASFSFMLYYFNFKRLKTIGLTTMLTVNLTYFYGVIVGLGHIQEGVFLSVLTTIILWLRTKSRHIIKHISQEEIVDILEFVILVGLVYPLLPETLTFGLITVPVMEIYYFVILLSVINFVAFIGARKLSAVQEIEVVSFFGGLAASTPTTLTLIKTIKKAKEHVVPLGISLATSAMLLRNFIIVSVVNYSYLVSIFPVFVIPFLILFIWGLSNLVCGKTCVSGRKDVMEIPSPFGVKNALRIGVGIFVIYTVLETLKQFIGDQAMLLLLFLGSIISSSGVAVSLAISGGFGMPISWGYFAIISGGLVSNILFPLWLGEYKVVLRTLPLFVVAFLGALLGLLLGGWA